MNTQQSRPGPRRAGGGPSGPQEVRRAVLDAAAQLYAEQGVDRVSLRDIAKLADVQVALIARYVGTRDELILATFEDLGQQLSDDVLARPLEGHGFEPDSTMGRWTRIAAQLALTGRLPAAQPFNPVRAIADTVVAAYGQHDEAARVRAAQVVASALGWRIFEEYLVSAGDLEGIDLERLRTDLTRAHRRLGAAPWPSPEDPDPGQRSLAPL